MNVLVTGATGFLGGKLVERLLKEGYHVTATGRNQWRGKQLQEAGAIFKAICLEDQQSMVQACRDQEVVFHCGARSAPWGSYREHYRSNVLGTQHVIEGCLTHSVKRLVYVSTPSIYFQYKDQFQISELSALPKTAINHYVKTKRVAEELVDEAYRKGLSVVTLRPRAIYGPGDNAIFPRLIRANRKRFVPLIREGRINIDITYVENCVDAMLLSMHSADSTSGKKYNITNGEPVMLLNVLEQAFSELQMPFHKKHLSYASASQLAGAMEWLAKYILLGKVEPIITRYSLGTLSFSQTLDITTARTELNYQPRISTAEGITLFTEWWKQENG